MSEYQHKEGSGAIFKNGKKEEGSKQPDYRGTIMLGGVVYEIAGWVKNGSKGSFLSLNGKVQGEAAPRRNEAPKARSDDADGIPF